MTSAAAGAASWRSGPPPKRLRSGSERRAALASTPITGPSLDIPSTVGSHVSRSAWDRKTAAGSTSLRSRGRSTPTAMSSGSST